MLRGRKLLLADDSIAIQKVIELTFEDEGMEVLSVGDGRQAVEGLAEVRPDIVLADVFMPELNGYQVCERIKGDERFRHIPVILLVGSFEPYNEAEARRVGADDYLTKPFQSIRQMVSKVGSLLSGNKGEGEAATQRLPAQPEQSPASGPAQPDNFDLSTADTAPLPQHMRPVAQPDSDARPTGPFADLQLDDEMIEETPASNFGSTSQTEAGRQPQQRPSEPHPSADLAGAGVNNTATGQQYAAATPASATSGAETTERTSARAAANDDALLDLDDVDLPHASAMDEADDFILDLREAADARPQAAPSAETARPSFESAQSFAAEGDEERAVEPAVETTGAAPQQVAEFVEAEVVEEQPSGYAFTVDRQSQEAQEVFPDSSQMQETGELRSDSQLAPTEKLPHSFQPETTPGAPAAAGEMTTAQPGQIGLEQLSPEVIDQIARRVVEQLSAKVVEQIAWEVVPPLAELLIKRRLEEEGKQ